MSNGRTLAAWGKELGQSIDPRESTRERWGKRVGAIAGAGAAVGAGAYFLRDRIASVRGHEDKAPTSEQEPVGEHNGHQRVEAGVS